MFVSIFVLLLVLALVLELLSWWNPIDQRIPVLLVILALLWQTVR